MPNSEKLVEEAKSLGMHVEERIDDYTLKDGIQAFKEETSREKKIDVAASRDFGTLMFVGKINSFLGWIVVVGGVMGVFVGFAQGGFAILAIALPGLFAAIIGLLIAASGQMISCLVSTERNSKDTTEILSQHTEILREISAKIGKESEQR
jgi:hypothetical protein